MWKVVIIILLGLVAAASVILLEDWALWLRQERRIARNRGVKDMGTNDPNLSITSTPVPYFPTPVSMTNPYDVASTQPPTIEISRHVLMWRHQATQERGSAGGDWTLGYMVARCEGNRQFWSRHPALDRRHNAPQPFCTCGIYGRETLYNDFHNGVHILLAGWGVIVEHEAGFRTQFGQVVAFTYASPHQQGRDTVWDKLGIQHPRSLEGLIKVADYYNKNPDALYDEVERLGLERQFRQGDDEPDDMPWRIGNA